MEKIRYMKKLKQKLYEWAMESPLRKWALSLTGWKWWFYQIVVCGIIFLLWNGYSIK